ncbi:hypothetical protein SLEP1_g4496 [Rubroshorea leprosula]|uniref:Reverse transcriptase zinc-binding domain-containing protein n=1 Tax=Rubroshorea leprosula TaxID=152421 RepID=A0AAV5HVA7_9ROSI|nr:hypothetical protein SLEP1_g4496 [Rubroshorea leprosula]
MEGIFKATDHPSKHTFLAPQPALLPVASQPPLLLVASQPPLLPTPLSVIIETYMVDNAPFSFFFDTASTTSTKHNWAFIPHFQSESEDYESWSLESEIEDYVCEKAVEKEQGNGRSMELELEDDDMECSRGELGGMSQSHVQQEEEETVEKVTDSLECFQISNGKVKVSKEDQMKRTKWCKEGFPQKRKKKIRLCSSVYLKARSAEDGMQRRKNRGRQNKKPKEGMTEPKFIASPNGEIAADSVGDSGIQNCNRALRKQLQTQLAKDIWDLAKRLGATAKNDEEILQKINEMEGRDKRSKEDLVRKYTWHNANGQHRSRIDSQVWNSDVVSGWMGFKLKEKLKKTKKAMKEWSANYMADVDRRISGAEKNITELDRKEENSQLIVEDIELRRSSFLDLWKNMRIKKSMLQQKSRKMWLKERDANTKFYHRSVKGRWRRNRINSIQINGEQYRGVAEIREGAIRYFKGLFTEEKWQRPKLDGINFRQLADKDNDFLMEKFTEEDIQNAVWDCDSTKSPGLDGFNFRFIKTMWEEIKQDVIGFVQEFHEHGKLILAKLLANRLRKVLGKIIGEQQMAFIKGRQLMDGVVIANEDGIHSYVEKVDKGMLAIEYDLNPCEWKPHKAIPGQQGNKIRRPAFTFSILISGRRFEWANAIYSGEKLIMEIGTEEGWKERMACRLCCKEGELPFKYLGIPAGGNHRKVALWKPLLESFKKKLASWKGQNLSLGGCITLLNFVLSSLPVYLISAYEIPKGILYYLDKIHRNFLWGGLGEEKKIKWVSWERVCRKKECGGLGVKDLRKFNLALMGKWWGRLAKVEEGLWGKVIREKYGENGGQWMNWVRDGRRVGSLWWRDLQSLNVGEDENEGWLTEGFRIKIGEGKRWEEEAEKELQKTIDKVKISPGCADRWEWIHSVDGQYSTTTAYAVLVKQRKEDEEEKILERVWNPTIPTKVAAFNWKVLIDRIPTRINLFKRGIIKDLEERKCALCKEEEEDSSHLFLNCNIAKWLWKACAKWWGITIVLQKECWPTFQHFGAWTKKSHKKEGWDCIWNAMLWTVWMLHNKKIFDNAEVG